MADDLSSVHRTHRPGDVVLRRKRLPRHHQRRVLGVPALFASAYGQLGAPVYYVLGLAALHGLALAPLALIVAAALFVLTAMTYAEGAAALPEGGGSPALARRAFNDLASFVAGWALWLAYVAGLALSAWVAVHYLSALLPELARPATHRAVTLVIIGVLAAANSWRGLLPARLPITAAALNLGTQAVVLTAGLVLLFDMETLWANVRLGAVPSLSPFLVAVALSMVAWTGVETMAHRVEEARAPHRVIPRAILFVAVAVLAVYIPSALVALSAMPMLPLPGGGWASDLVGAWQPLPFLGIVNALPGVLRGVLRLWVPLLAAVVLVLAANANFHGLTHLASGMGQRQQLPALLSRVPGRFRAPVGALVLAALAAGALVVPGRLYLMADVYAFAVLLVFAAAHAALLALRRQEPQLPRPYRAPLNVRLGGHLLPLTAVGGLLAMLLLWGIVLWLRPDGRWLGLAWLAAGLVMYTVWRLGQRLPLTQRSPAPEPPAPARPAGDTPAP